MKRDLESLLTDIRKGKGPSLLLVHGDDLRVRDACREILDLLVPPENRAFNLESFDGRSAPWEEIQAALMTPPFFSGRKVVLVENAPYFISREHKGELGERILQLWGEGKKEEAARLFLDLLALEGWTRESWEELQGPLPAGQLAALFGGDEKEGAAEVGDILSFCRAGGLHPMRLGGGPGDGLADLCEQGPPPWGFLLISASHVDRRTRLYRRLDETGSVLDLSVARARGGRISGEVVAEFLGRRLKDAGKRIEPQAKEMILLRAGDQLWTVHQELEKLLLYVGAEPWVRIKHVEEAFADRGEAWIFDLTDDVARRDPLAALERLARLLSQDQHPLKILGAIAGEVRRLLSARQLIEGEMRDRLRKGMTYPQFQRSVLREGAPLLTRSAYGDYMVFQRAENFTSGELLRYLELIHETDLRLKSSGQSGRIAMERLILEMCRPPGRAQIAE